jgi:adenosylcobinamide kinase / adenosylcobinamide-phosphate guanylyltransferase
MRTLLIGGARSGKSALALRWAHERSNNVTVLVTGAETDPEMSARIDRHRRERPAHWQVHEEPVHLGRALRQLGDGLVLVDCLTVWISNCLWPPGPMETPELASWRAEQADFIQALNDRTADTLIVTNEVGTGIVPDNAVARVFRDEQGWLNQSVAAVCDEVFLVTAGLPLCLKSSRPGSGSTTTPPR